MAIYHLSMQAIKRSEGRSSVAAAAYRAGQVLTDKRTGLTHEYKRTERVVHAEMFAPAGCDALIQSRQIFWSLVEELEKRKDATVCREMNAALPRELTESQRTQLAREFAAEFSRRFGVVVDLAIHDDGGKNPHLHLMFSDRIAKDNQLGKKDRAWGVAAGGRERVKEVRQLWADMSNRALEAAGYDERITAQSLKDQGITDREPTVHEGPRARAMHARGITSDRVQINADAAKIEDAGKRLASLADVIAAKKAARASADTNHADAPTSAPEAAKIVSRGILLPSLTPSPQPTNKTAPEAEETRPATPPAMDLAQRRRLITAGLIVDDIHPVLERYGQHVKLEQNGRLETMEGERFAYSVHSRQWYHIEREGASRPVIEWIAKREGLTTTDAAIKNAMDTQAEQRRQIERERERSQSTEHRQDAKQKRGFQPK